MYLLLLGCSHPKTPLEAQPDPAQADPAQPVIPREQVASALRDMVETDQLIRNQITPGNPANDVLSVKMSMTDQHNTKVLKSLVAAYGWITISDFGEKAAHDAWLLAQHADLDPDFQREVLAKMEPLLASHETSAKDYGYLWDRVAVAQQQPQRYGTQGRCGTDRWTELPVEAPDQLDARRAEIGLGPMSDYRALFDCGGLMLAAEQAYEAKDYAGCARSYRAIAETREGKASAIPWYNAACCAALSGATEDAFLYLGHVTSQGEPLANTCNDADLASLHVDARWSTLCSQP